MSHMIKREELNSFLKYQESWLQPSGRAHAHDKKVIVLISTISSAEKVT